MFPKINWKFRLPKSKKLEDSNKILVPLRGVESCTKNKVVLQYMPSWEIIEESEQISSNDCAYFLVLEIVPFGARLLMDKCDASQIPIPQPCPVPSFFQFTDDQIKLLKQNLKTWIDGQYKASGGLISLDLTNQTNKLN